MVDDITLQKRTLRVLIVSALLVTVCLIFLNPDLAIPADPSQIDYFGVLAVLFFWSLWFYYLFSTSGVRFFSRSMS